MLVGLVEQGLRIQRKLQRAFARPIRSLLALLGTEVVPFTLFEVASGRTTEGHPILSPGKIEVSDAGFESYKKLLRERLKGKIEVDMDTARRLFTLICVLHLKG